MSTSAALSERSPATTLSVVVATALIAGVTGYFVGKGASIGLFCNPASSSSIKKGEHVDTGLKGSEDSDESEDSSDSEEEDSDEEDVGDLANFDSNKEDVKLVLVVRTDLGMTKGMLLILLLFLLLKNILHLVLTLQQGKSPLSVLTQPLHATRPLSLLLPRDHYFLAGNDRASLRLLCK